MINLVLVRVAQFTVPRARTHTSTTTHTSTRLIVNLQLQLQESFNYKEHVLHVHDPSVSLVKKYRAWIHAGLGAGVEQVVTPHAATFAQVGSGHK